MAWWKELSDGLTSTALDMAEYIPVVGESVEKARNGDVSTETQTAPAVASVDSWGFPFLIEIYGPKGSPLSEKKGVLFNSGSPMSAFSAIALFIVLLIVILVMAWVLLMPDKKKKSGKGKRRALK